MKIAIVINSDVGLYKFRKELIERLLENYQVSLLVPKGDYTSYFQSIGCSVTFSKISRRSTALIGEVNLLKEYYQFIKREKPDIILTYTIKPNLYVGIVAKVFSIPVISTITGLGTFITGEGTKKKLARKLYASIVSQSKVVFFQNKQNYDLFNIKNKVLVNGSGVNLSNYKYTSYPSDDGNIHLLFVGRLMKDKGIIELCTVAKKLIKENNKVVFHIVGEKERDFEYNITDYEIPEKIIFYGSKNSVLPFYQMCHAIIHPSYHEGLSNVLLEAAACGRPIIASDIPGCRETFDDGISGISFQPKSIEKLESAICLFLSKEHTEKEEMGKKARIKIENEFNREKIIQKYLEYI